MNEKNIEDYVYWEYISMAKQHLEDYLYYGYKANYIVFGVNNSLKQCYVGDFFKNIDRTLPYKEILRRFVNHITFNNRVVDGY